LQEPSDRTVVVFELLARIRQDEHENTHTERKKFKKLKGIE